MRKCESLGGGQVSPRAHSAGSEITCRCAEGVGEKAHGKPCVRNALARQPPELREVGRRLPKVRAVSRKKLGTRENEIQALNRWTKHLGGVRVDWIRPDRMPEEPPQGAGSL